MKIIACALAIALTAPWPQLAFAADGNRCGSPQNVSLSWNGTHLSDWVVIEDEIKPFDLPNGFSLGIKIGPADEQDLVEISLYDMSRSGQPRLTHTYGGTNSLQGYGANGGADRLEELGDPGILLELAKPPCGSDTETESASRAP